MANKLGIMVCENLKPEATAVIESEGFDDVMVLAFPAHDSGRTRIGWDALGEVIQACENECGQIHVLGGCCLAGLAAPPRELKHSHLHQAEQCFHLFANKNILDDYLKGGAHLLTPGWLAHWRRYVDDWGFDGKTAGNFFKESATRLVLLDTGVDAGSSEHLEQFADFIGLPFEILPVGLDFFRQFLVKIVLEWRLEAERNRSAALWSATNRRLSDYAMRSDLVIILAGVTDEPTVIEKVIDLFNTLCSPASVVYLPLVDGKPGNIQSSSESAIDKEAVKKRLSRLRENYGWTASGNGFFVRFIHRDETLGVIEVDGIPFPEYQRHYLNLGLTISQVCGLAIVNARVFQNIQRMQETLVKAKDKLEERVEERTAELSASTEQLRTLSRRLVEAHEEERRTIAKDLHDQIGQTLTMVNILVDTALKSPPENIHAILSEAKASLVEAVQETRDISLRLRPSILDDLGLLPALIWHVQNYTEKTDIQVDLQHAGLDRDLPADIHTGAYRIVQEALTNIARHAGVNKAKVIIRVEKGTLFIEIEDRGKGFDQAELPINASVGLSSMQERVYALGGTLKIASKPGAGTRVTVKLPLPKPLEAETDERDTE